VLAPNDPAVWGNGRLDDVGVVVLDEVHYLVGRCTFNR
jgi:superfamily II helicase